MIAALLALAAATTLPATKPFRCGAVERPGIAEPDGAKGWRGAAVDLCRKIARTERRPGATIAFRVYPRIADLRDARNDDLSVLSRAELGIALPATSPLSDSPVAVSRQVLLVRADAPLHDPSELAGRKVCFIVASEAEAALNVWAGSAQVAILRVGFQETVELRDGFDSGYCAAIAVDADDIPGSADHTRALGPALTETPVFAIRPNQDGR